MNSSSHSSSVKDTVRAQPLAVALFAFPLFFFFQPSALKGGSLAPMMEWGALLAMAATLLFYIYTLRMEIAGILAISYVAVMLLSCVSNGGSIYYGLLSYGSLGSAILLGRAAMVDFRRELLWGVVAVAGGYSLLNLFALCAFPVGTPVLRPDAGSTFLSYRNSFCHFYFAAIASSLLLDALAGKVASARSIIFYGAALLQSTISYSATSVLALVGFALFFALCNFCKPRRYLNALSFLTTYLLLFLAIVVLRLQNVFSGLVGILGRDLTFTGRTNIWDQAMSLIQPDHLLLGYYGTPGMRIVVPANGTDFGSAHNALLDIMVWGGLAAALLIAAIVALVSLNLYRERNNRSASIISIFLGVFLLMGLVELITCFSFFLFLGIGWKWREESAENSSKDPQPLPPDKALHFPRHRS